MMSFHQAALAALLFFNASVLAGPCKLSKPHYAQSSTSNGDASTPKYSRTHVADSSSTTLKYGQPSYTTDSPSTWKYDRPSSASSYSPRSKYSRSSSVRAAYTPSGNAGNTKCYTEWGQYPPFGAIETSWTTHSASCTPQILSVTVSVTTTPGATTLTVPATITETSTAPTSVLTAVQTEANTITQTAVTTETELTTSTETTTTSTSTVIAAPEGFTPVQDTLPGATYAGLGGSAPVVPLAKRSVLAGRDIGASPKSFGDLVEQKVRCEVWPAPGQSCAAETRTVTTTFAAASPTAAITVTETETTVFVPSATTTITTTTDTIITVTETDTETVTLFATETATVPGPTPTVYAACAQTNLADSYIPSGQGFGNLFGGQEDTFNLESSLQDSAYDCCVHVFTTPSIFPGHSLDAWAYGNPGAFGGGVCYVYSSQTCPVTQNTALSNNSEFTIGNGLCGSITGFQN